MTRRLHSPGGLRVRVVAVTTGLLALSLALAALVLVWVVATTSRTAGDADVSRTASEVAALVDANRMPTTLPVSGARMVQVVAVGEPPAEPSVVAASSAADRLTPLLSAGELASALTGEVVEVPANRVGEPGTLRAVAREAGPQAQRLAVIAASPRPDTSETLRPVLLGLAVALPLLLLTAALLSWRAVGATLAPVDALRVGAERIGSHRTGAAAMRRSADGADGVKPPTRLPVPQTRDEIRALAVTLNGMLDRLDAAAQTHSRFVADAAHELRSPVASLRMQVEVAARLGEGGDLPVELLPDIERLGRLVDDLLLLARVGSPRSAHRPTSVDVVGIVDEVVARCRSARVPVRATGRDPDGPGCPGSVIVTVDPSGLERAIGNLVDNAVRHAASRVEVRVGRGGGPAVIEVVDDGAGIAAADRERAFDRFTRLDEARDRDAGGSGLGLAIVRELVRREGGEVSLHDADPGLRARITLPR